MAEEVKTVVDSSNSAGLFVNFKLEELSAPPQAKLLVLPVSFFKPTLNGTTPSTTPINPTPKHDHPKKPLFDPVRKSMSPSSAIVSHICEYCEKVFRFRSSVLRHINKGRCKSYVKPEPGSGINEWDSSPVFARNVENSNTTNGEEKPNGAVLNSINLISPSTATKIILSTPSNRIITKPKKMRFEEEETSSSADNKLSDGDGDEKDGEEKPGEEKAKFTCEICEAQLSRREALANHMRIHSGEKPFPCLVCEKTFRLKTTLRRHMLILHRMGENEFLCEVCDKRFAYRCNLRDHLTKHIDVLPYECNNCKMRYRTEETLFAHQELHKKKKKKKKSSAPKPEIINFNSTEDEGTSSSFHNNNGKEEVLKTNQGFSNGAVLVNSNLINSPAGKFQGHGENHSSGGNSVQNGVQQPTPKEELKYRALGSAYAYSNSNSNAVLPPREPIRFEEFLVNGEASFKEEDESYSMIPFELY